MKPMFLVLSLLLAFANSTLAQPTQSPMVPPLPPMPPTVTISAPAIPMRDPALHQVAFDAFQVPGGYYRGDEKPSSGAIRSLHAVTNNLSTWIRVTFQSGIDLNRASVRLLIDSDGNYRTGSGVGFWGGQDMVENFGFDHTVVVDRYGVSVMQQGQSCCIHGYAEIADVTAESYMVKISNRLFREDGRVSEMRFQAVLFDNRTGVELSISPRRNTADIPSTTSVRLSPTTKSRLYKLGTEDTAFPLVADITTAVPDSQVTYYVLVNGMNMTNVFTENWRSGTKMMNQQRVGSPNQWNFTRRFIYPIGSIVQSGGRVRVDLVVLTSDGMAVDTVEYSAEEIVESPGSNQQRP